VLRDLPVYTLLGADGRHYSGEDRGTLGGNSKLRIYGQLDCWSARNPLRAIALPARRSADARAPPRRLGGYEDIKRMVSRRADSHAGTDR
jgi:hypothetical protein